MRIKLRTGKLPKTEKTAKPAVTPGISLTIRLPSTAAIQVRDSAGTLLGTVFLDENGLQYRRANAVLDPSKRLSYAVLGKVMESNLTLS